MAKGTQKHTQKSPRPSRQPRQPTEPKQQRSQRQPRRQPRTTNGNATKGNATKNNYSSSNSSGTADRTYGSHHSTVLDGYSYNRRAEQQSQSSPRQRQQPPQQQRQQQKNGQRQRQANAVVPGKQSWATTRQPSHVRPGDQSKIVLVPQQRQQPQYYDEEYVPYAPFSSMDVPGPPSVVDLDFSGTVEYKDGYAQNITKDSAPLEYSNQYYRR